MTPFSFCDEERFDARGDGEHGQVFDLDFRTSVVRKMMPDSNLFFHHCGDAGKIGPIKGINSIRVKYGLPPFDSSKFDTGGLRSKTEK